MRDDPASSRLVFISAAEPSADLHAAHLISAVRAENPSIRFAGLAGPRMVQAGCESLYDMTQHAAMATGAIKVVPRALTALRKCKRFFRDHPVDLAIVVDSPALHLPLARHARRARLPVLYFIAPQLWAWAQSRIKRLRSRVDKLAVILPFEEKFFRDRGVDTEYVGNPLFDELTARRIDPDRVARLRANGDPLIAIFPGSRAHVASEVFPGQLEVATRIAQRFSRAHFCISVANPRVRSLIESKLASATLSTSIHENENGHVLSAATFALVASGTATLETAYYHVPMVVMYNASRIAYHLFGRWVISTPHLALINILAGREIVPEFMPFYRSTRPISDKCLALLESSETLSLIRKELTEVVDPIVKTGAARNTARLVLEMLNRTSNLARRPAPQADLRLEAPVQSAHDET